MASNRGRGRRPDSGVGGRVHTHRTSSRNRLSSESSSARTSSRRAERIAREPRQRGRQLARVQRLHDETVAGGVERHACHRLERDEAAASRARVVGADEHVAGPVVHRVADRVVPAGGREPPVHEHDHPLREPLDLVENVRADDHRSALRAEVLEQLDEAQALHGIGAVQRLVEHEHVRIGHERGRDLGALPHALAERVDAPVGDVEHRHRSQRFVGRASGRRRDSGRRRSERTGARVSAAGTASSSGTSAIRRCTARSRRGSRPSTRTVPWLTPSSPVSARMSVVLPAPFGPSRPVTPGPERAAQLRQRDLGAEPDRNVGDLDRRVGHERGIGHHRSTHR